MVNFPVQSRFVVLTPQRGLQQTKTICLSRGIIQRTLCCRFLNMRFSSSFRKTASGILYFRNTSFEAPKFKQSFHKIVIMADVQQESSSTVDRKAIGEGGSGNLEKPSSGHSKEDRPELEQVENVKPTNNTFGKRRRVRNHCARFWLWWLVGVIVFLAIFLPCL